MALSHVLSQHTPKKSTPVVATGLSSQPTQRTLDSVTQESRSTTVYLASGSPLRSATDSGFSRDNSATRWSVESGRRAPVGGLALTPPSRSPERSMFLSKVDRGTSPFRYSELSPLVMMQSRADVPAEKWKSWMTVSPSKPRCSFARSTAVSSDLKTYEDRHVVTASLGARSTDHRRSPSPARNLRSAVDYRRDALKRQRRLQVLESNRTLEKFMQVLRQEKEAKAMAALFAIPSSVNCRHTPKTISFAVDGELLPATSSAVTLSLAETGNICRSKNKPTRPRVRCNSPTAGRSANDFRFRLDNQRHQAGNLKAWNRRDIEKDWAKCLWSDRSWRVSTPRPAR